jgi:hypothetical protein
MPTTTATTRPTATATAAGNGSAGSAGPSWEVLGRVGVESAERRAGGCARPVRLVGEKSVVNTSTGEVGDHYTSADELDGITYLKCGNRRVQACPTCSAEYKSDAWHLLLCGLAGGKGIAATVSDHACTFATFTAPSFGAVHGVRDKGPCRARRDKPVCVHGRPAWCSKRHHDDDKTLGSPLCLDCYDYTAHVVWQWHAPELWRRFTITLQRDLARHCALSVKRFRDRVRISYSKVVEFQARGVIHLHVPIRLDGPDGPDGPAPDQVLGLDTEVLEDAVISAAAKVTLDASLADGTVHRLHWGRQLDTRSITDTTHRDTGRRARVVHPEQVAAYLAKYLTKATEDFGLPSRIYSAQHARLVGASAHVVRIIETAQRVAAENDGYSRLVACLTTLGYRGHPITKSRTYSVTFGQIRRARRRFRQNPAGLDPQADIRQLLDTDDDLPDGFELEATWVFIGQGYLDLDQAAAAVTAAMMARSR